MIAQRHARADCTQDDAKHQQRTAAHDEVEVPRLHPAHTQRAGKAVRQRAVRNRGGEQRSIRVDVRHQSTGIDLREEDHQPGKRGQLVRSAGNVGQLMAKEGKYATVKLPSGEMRLLPIECRATIGQIGNADHELVHIGKAGRKRHMGVRPTVRGSVMNTNDHPHGGGEGRAPIGRPAPMTPWGKPAMGYKTRN